MATISRGLDAAAVVLSGICVVHCIAVPLALTLVPLFAISLGTDQHFHGLMLGIALPISVLALGLGTWRHRRGLILGTGFAAMALLAFASTWGHAHLDVYRESALMLVASVALAMVHLWNYRSVYRCTRHDSGG